VTRKLIITGDDFGLAVPVNEAIERAYREGVLTSTSLLIGAPAAQDAIERARRNPGLRVGLHIAVCEGRPLLPAREIPALTQPRSGMFHRPLQATLRFMLLRSSMKQLEAELRAQFEAFAATGLTFDHVDGHCNMQLHPVVLPILIQLAKRFGVGSLRLPYEPFWPSWRATRRRVAWRALAWFGLYCWTRVVKRRLRREGLRHNDYLFGMYDCGALALPLWLGFVRELPLGVSEIHCHPATQRCAEIDATMPTYCHEAELDALTSPLLRDALSRPDLEQCAGYRDLERELARSQSDVRHPVHVDAAD
jgi:hopanoid biosynthesis associated protein HpnK